MMSLSQESLVGQRKGFTLIELLVVVAIIAVLVAVLIPSLSNARENAKSTICKNNLKQIHTLLRMYSEEFAGRYPGTDTVGKAVYRRAPGLVSQGDGGVPEYLGLQSTLERWKSGITDPTAIPESLTLGKVFICPSAIPTLQEFKNTYSYNSTAGGRYKYLDQWAFLENKNNLTGAESGGILNVQWILEAFTSTPVTPSGSGLTVTTTVSIPGAVRPHFKNTKRYYNYVSITGEVLEN